MICIAALIVLAILSLISAKYRPYAKEAFGCVTRRLTLRPCRARFDLKVKVKIIGKLGRTPRLARFAHKRFEAISWAFTIVMIVSLILTANGFYNLAAHGSCDPHSTTCIFNPGVTTCGSESCAERGCDCEALGCEAPEFKACGGDCDCKKDVCG